MQDTDSESGMIENIKRIGLFMIVAQTFIHFAAGQQYEKYIKIITGIIILLLFITPFSSSFEKVTDQWQEEMDQITEQIERHNNTWQNKLSTMDLGTEKRTMRQLEIEIKGKLNREMPLEGWQVADVTIDWSESTEDIVDGNQELDVQCITITLSQAVRNEGGPEREDTDGLIVIEEIKTGTQSGSVGQNSGPDDSVEQNEEQMAQYRSTFAGILGIEEEKVEVVYSGNG